VAIVDVETRARTAGRAFCAAVSSVSDEPLAATASRLDHWILVEYRGAWSRDVLGESLLSAELKAHLREQLDALERSRLLFLKKPERRAQAGRSVFFGTSRPGQERFFRLEVEHQDDLRGFNFAAALADGGASAEPLERPLFVVCTHGKRDRCCALRGRPLYDALRQEVDPDLVWQSTHVGGDRFAGNVVALPDGVYYGRVEPGESWPVVEAALRGEIHLPHYRGRSCHSFPAQAAERAVREATGLVGVADTSVLSLEPVGAGWQAVVHAGGEDYAVEVRREEGAPTHLTCSTEQLRRPKRHVAELRAGGSPHGRAS
jgi:hypothetical protein